MITTALTEMFGLDHPIVLAPMGMGANLAKGHSGESARECNAGLPHPTAHGLI